MEKIQATEAIVSQSSATAAAAVVTAVTTAHLPPVLEDQGIHLENTKTGIKKQVVFKNQAETWMNWKKKSDHTCPRTGSPNTKGRNTTKRKLQNLDKI